MHFMQELSDDNVDALERNSASQRLHGGKMPEGSQDGDAHQWKFVAL